MFDNEVGDAVGDDARLPASRSGEDENGAIAVHHCLPLRFVQSFEQFGLACDGLHQSQSSIRSPGLSISVSPSQQTWGTVGLLDVKASGGNG